MLEFNDFSNLDKNLSREWLITNGIGGYSSSTIIGANTRGYHGLLISALEPPRKRFLFLSKLEELVLIDGKKFWLSTNEHADGTVFPNGYQNQSLFQLYPVPTFIYQVAGIKVTKQVYMIQNVNATVIEYTTEGLTTPRVEILPLTTFRDFHSKRRWTDLYFKQDQVNNRIDIYCTQHEDLKLALIGINGSYESDPAWYYNFKYRIDDFRQTGSNEDLFRPGKFLFKSNRFQIIAIADKKEIVDERIKNLDLKNIVQYREKIRENNEKYLNFIHQNYNIQPNLLIDSLLLAGRQFIVGTADQAHSIIAGYHWFSDWGRDILISIPGLTLVTKQHEIARSILKRLARFERNGLIPNTFSENIDEILYNTADASLWFILTCHKYYLVTKDLDFMKEVFPTIQSIIQNYLKGTDFNIHADEDGLIIAGTPKHQLTWMDAKCGNVVFTPRHDRPIELQCLWYNALKIFSRLAKLLGRTIDLKIEMLTKKVKNSI
ncbi:MAG: amylo-alpha-1,6-glucosidase, partial [Promethearchaeota archaeon]